MCMYSFLSFLLDVPTQTLHAKMQAGPFGKNLSALLQSSYSTLAHSTNINCSIRGPTHSCCIHGHARA